MAEYTSASKVRRASLDPRLQEIVDAAVQIYPLYILEGYRGEEAQNKAYAEGHSRLRWPDSKHNTMPSLAVDLAPRPLDWSNTAEFAYLAGIIMTIAAQKGIPLTWGGRWAKLKDMPHFELA